MEIIEVGQSPVAEYVAQAKEHNQFTIKGKARDTVKAVDVAELLKIEGFKVKGIKISTEENQNKRTSVILIEMEK